MSDAQTPQKDKPLCVLILWNSGTCTWPMDKGNGDTDPDKMTRAAEQLLTIAAVAGGLTRHGFRVADVDIEDNMERVRDALLLERPHVIYNLVHELAGSHAPAFPAYLDLHGVAYTGSSSMCLAICQDRARTHVLLRSAAIPVSAQEQGSSRRIAAIALGGQTAEVLPLVELCPDAGSPWQPAALGQRTAAAVRALARRAFEVMECRDVAQIDIDLDLGGRKAPCVSGVCSMVPMGPRSAFAAAASHTRQGLAGVARDIALMAASRSREFARP